MTKKEIKKRLKWLNERQKAIEEKTNYDIYDHITNININVERDELKKRLNKHERF